MPARSARGCRAPRVLISPARSSANVPMIAVIEDGVLKGEKERVFGSDVGLTGRRVGLSED